MNNFKNKEEEFLHSLSQYKRIKVSDELRKKSLLSFQEGLKDTGKDRISEKPRIDVRKFSGIVAGAAALAITSLLVFNIGIIDNNLFGVGGKEENTEVVEENKKDDPTPVEKEETDQQILEKIMNRPSIGYEVLNGSSRRIFNNKLEVQLPFSWKITETEMDHSYQIEMTKDEDEQMNLILFDKEPTEEVLQNHLQELTTDYENIEGIQVPVQDFVESLRSNIQLPSTHPNGVTFDIENAEITGFYNQETGRFLEVYISELFGYPMIFTSEFSYDDEDAWSNAVIFFMFMYIGSEQLEVHGSLGDIHPVHERPVEKTVVLRVGAIGMEEVEMELYENDELGLTSYLSKDTNIERIEHNNFVEWRFTEPGVSENSFYSFGKLKEGFPIEKGKEIMFEAHNINLSAHEETDGPIQHHFSYHDPEAFIDGYIELFERNGEWYYKHKHADRHDYNGGVYFQRLDMFIDSIEWY